MRRTADHGWIAKAYTIGSTDDHSKPHLNLFEDLSDCESLDSFFDDDFDTQTSEQKLGNILSCNTLGVDSKVKTIVGKICFINEDVNTTMQATTIISLQVIYTLACTDHTILSLTVGQTSRLGVWDI